MSLPGAVELISSHILECLSSASRRPLFVALQGPQGSGKSYSTALVQTLLSNPPHSLRVAVLSIDDLYLPHNGLLSLASDHPHNPLWRGRGQPGTHDIQLGVQLLQSLRRGDKDVEIPRFEKSLYNGEGDRLPLDGTGVIIKPPVDVVLMEGWCTGFFPISQAELDKRWVGVWREERRNLGLGDDELGTKENIQDVNDKLKEYIHLWTFFDVFVQLSPAPSPDLASPYSVIYKWRLEQEHYMKSRNGGKGMSDEAVKSFVDRYVPGYVFFGDGVSRGYVDEDDPRDSAPQWKGQSLRVVIDERRQVVDVERF